MSSRHRKTIKKKKKKELFSQSLCSSSSTKRAATFSFIVIHVHFKADPSVFPFWVDGLRNILCAPFVSVVLKKWRSKGQRLLPQDDRKSRLVSRSSPLRLPSSFCPFSRRSLTVSGSSYERRSVLIAVEIYTLECLHSRVPVFSNIRVLFGTLIREYINSSGSRVCEYLTFTILAYELPIFWKYRVNIRIFFQIFWTLISLYIRLYPLIAWIFFMLFFNNSWRYSNI